MRNRILRLAFLCALAFYPGLAALAQTAPKPVKLGPLTVTGSLRLRVENWNWFDTTAADPNYTFFAAVFRLGIGQQKERFEWKLELEQPTLLNLPEHAIAPAPQGALGLGANYFAANGSWAMSAFPKQAYFKFTGRGRHPSSFRLGRFEFIEGLELMPQDATLATLKRERIAHRLIGNFAFSHVGRSFDGIQLEHETQKTNFDLVFARPTRGVFQVDGWGELDVDVLYGALTHSVARGYGQWRLFAIAYHDGRRALKTDNRSAAARTADQHNIRLETFGGAAVRGAAGHVAAGREVRYVRISGNLRRLARPRLRPHRQSVRGRALLRVSAQAPGRRGLNATTQKRRMEPYHSACFAIAYSYNNSHMFHVEQFAVRLRAFPPTDD
jgi:hypothetical protein